MINNGRILLPHFLLENESALLIWRDIGEKPAMHRNMWVLGYVSQNLAEFVLCGFY